MENLRAAAQNMLVCFRKRLEQNSNANSAPSPSVGREPKNDQQVTPDSAAKIVDPKSQDTLVCLEKRKFIKDYE